LAGENVKSGKYERSELNSNLIIEKFLIDRFAYALLMARNQFRWQNLYFSMCSGLGVSVATTTELGGEKKL
jgi:hypothetical protein